MIAAILAVIRGYYVVARLLLARSLSSERNIISTELWTQSLLQHDSIEKFRRVTLEPRFLVIPKRYTSAYPLQHTPAIDSSSSGPL